MKSYQVDDVSISENRGNPIISIWLRFENASQKRNVKVSVQIKGLENPFQDGDYHMTNGSCIRCIGGQDGTDLYKFSMHITRDAYNNVINGFSMIITVYDPICDNSKPQIEHFTK